MLPELVAVGVPDLNVAELQRSYVGFYLAEVANHKPRQLARIDETEDFFDSFVEEEALERVVLATGLRHRSIFQAEFPLGELPHHAKMS